MNDDEGIGLNREYPSILVVIDNRPFAIQVNQSAGMLCGVGEWMCSHVSSIQGNGYKGFQPSHPETPAKYRAACRQTPDEALLDGVRFALAVQRYGEGFVT